MIGRNMAREDRFAEHRRSTRVRLDVSIGVEGESGVMKGVTVVVNLHGALIRVPSALEMGSRVIIEAYLTGKSVPAHVVFVSPDDPQTYGIELEMPQNIWGVSLTPDDWEQEREMAAEA